MHPHAPSGQSDASAKSRAVVIGSGFGGLAAAIHLLARGYAVDVCEALDQPGGRARVFRAQAPEGEFVFDAGPTVLTAPFLFEELFAALGEQLRDHVDVRRIDPFYKIRFADGTTFHYNGDAAQMRAEVARLAPDDVAGYEAFVAQSERIYKTGFEALAHVPFGSAWDMARIVPAMVRLQSYRTVWQLVCRYVKNDKLRQVLSFHPLLVGGNPFDTTSIYSLILFLERRFGVHFPMGGTGALVRALVQLIERHGGKVHLSAPVARIATHGTRAVGVSLADGRTLPADVVVSNADSAETYRKLLAHHPRRRWTDRRIARQRYSMGLFVWYFGTRRSYPDVAHHSILLGPRYKALLADIFDHHVLAEDFSLYLHRPTATDPSLAPDGCDAFYVLSPVPHLDAKVDWATQAERYRERLAEALEATVLPDLRANLAASRVMTPQHFEGELQSYKGAAFGMAPTLRQSAYFRPHNRSEELENLYLVGAGTHPGAGMPGVLSSAKVVASLVPEADLSGGEALAASAAAPAADDAPLVPAAGA